jgi:pimeloyl-ACP methyl ester carboxylesterase
MQTLRVNGYDMAYLEVGHGPPLVCVHGTLGDFRTWSAVLGPLSLKHRVISLSLRHFFPEHWSGVGNDYLMSRHVADVIGFIEQLGAGPVDLMGHSRGGTSHFALPSSVRICCAASYWPSPAANSIVRWILTRPRGRPVARQESPRQLRASQAAISTAG